MAPAAKKKNADTVENELSSVIKDCANSLAELMPLLRTVSDTADQLDWIKGKILQYQKEVLSWYQMSGGEREKMLEKLYQRKSDLEKLRSRAKDEVSAMVAALQQSQSGSADKPAVQKVSKRGAPMKEPRHIKRATMSARQPGESLQSETGVAACKRKSKKQREDEESEESESSSSSTRNTKKKGNEAFAW